MEIPRIALPIVIGTLLFGVGFRPTLALYVRGAGLAETSAMRTLRNGPSLLVDVRESAVFSNCQ